MAAPETSRRLPDGTELLVRPVQAEDRDLLARGFERFGPESRYFRFLTSKKELSDNDLRYLTELDGNDHFAIGAVMLDERGERQPVGIARFVRLAPAAEVAEVAVAVVDAMQGKGVGKLLLRELSDAAYARGVRRFRCSVLASNEAINKLISELNPDVRVVRSEAGVNELEVEIPVPSEEGATAPRKLLEHLLRMLAEKLVAWVPSLPSEREPVQEEHAGEKS